MIQMVQRSLNGVTRFVRRVTQDKFFEGLLVIMSAFSAILGLLFIFFPFSLTTSLGFELAFDHVDPLVWGGILVICGGLLSLMGIPHRTRQQAMWPGFAIGVVYIGLSVAFIRATFNGGVPSGIVIYMLAAFVSMWIVAGCAFFDEDLEERRRVSASQNPVAHHP